MRTRIAKVRPRERAAFQARLAALERLATYPLGDDTFRLDHGPDYFAFFDRLGEVLYAAALEGETLAAVACGMLRRVPFRQGEAPRRTWYLADLKVHPDYRGRRLPLRMLGRYFPWNYLRCPRGYAISMDPAGGGPNRIARLLGHWRWSPIAAVATLLIWSLDAAAAERAAPIVVRHRGPLSVRSLEGVKDLILGSTGRRMPLLHAEWPRRLGSHAEPPPDPARAGPSTPGSLRSASAQGERFLGPQAGHTHMFCAPEGDPLAADLAGLGLRPGATATILAHRMKRCDWRFVLTSEI